VALEAQRTLQQANIQAAQAMLAADECQSVAEVSTRYHRQV
jgi:hypothetical protein